MKWVGLILTVTLGLLGAPSAADAQQAGKVPRIGILWARGPIPSLDDALLQGLRELGHTEGRNIVIERRYAGGNAKRLPELAAELVQLKVDVIVAVATVTTQAARTATTTTPIVMVAVGDPVHLGFVGSLARPGGNTTGLTFTTGMEVFGKTLELLKEGCAVLRFFGTLPIQHMKRRCQTSRLRLGHCGWSFNPRGRVVLTSLTVPSLQ